MKSLWEGCFRVGAYPHVFVQAEVFVGDDVPQSGELVPFNIWITRSYLRRNVFGCFSNDFEIAHDGIEGLFILHKLVKV